MDEEYKCLNCKWFSEKGMFTAGVCARITPVAISPERVYTYIMTQDGVNAELVVDTDHLCKLWEPKP